MIKHKMKEVIRDPVCRECGIRTLHLYRVKGLEREQIKMCAICATLALEEMEIYQLNQRREDEFNNEDVRRKASLEGSNSPGRSSAGIRSDSTSGEELGTPGEETSRSRIGGINERAEKEGDKQGKGAETCPTCEEAPLPRKTRTN